MTERYQLIAYVATLGTLAAVFIAALIASSLAPDIIGKMEVFGLGTITGGLIGVLRMPTRNAPATAVQNADTVVGGPQEGA